MNWKLLLPAGEIPLEIGNLPLELLDMENSGLGGILPSSIYNITSLRSINLFNNKFYGSLPAKMCSSLPVLQYLDFRRNEFTGNLPRDIGNCSLLIDFFLSGNRFSGMFKDFLAPTNLEVNIEQLLSICTFCR